MARTTHVQRRRYRKLQTVLIGDITGTEDHRDDFDTSFRPLRLHNRERWISLATASCGGVGLPVQLVQVGSE